MHEARAAEGLSRIQDEIASEKAAALARIAGTLEALLADLRRIEAEAAESREQSAARHREVRERALRYRWYLEVQRESVGLTRHEALDELYPVPEPI